jgi:glutamate-1-semialdehyde 2,1-aminomutase
MCALSVGSGSATSGAELYASALEAIAGGVTAAHRWNPVLGRPFFATRGEGAHVWDESGRRYLDLNTSFGASLLGHRHPAIVAAVERALEIGILCSFETPWQQETARKVQELVPSAERVRFTGSGTEATFYAIRVARTFTGRDLVVKFEGHFHGYSDQLAFSAWPALAEAGPADHPATVPESAGIPRRMASDILVAPWNDTGALESLLAAHRGQVAAVIMEPINYNSGTLLPAPGYLEAVRGLADREGVVLIFDEILSGFRTGPDCAQGLYGVTPDLTTLGKAFGGGTPLCAYVGRNDILSTIAPIGPAVHTGTYNGHLFAILAAGAFLDLAADPAFWVHLEALGAAFYPGLQEAFDRAGVPCRVQAKGARFSLLFGLREPATSYREAVLADRELERRFYGAALERGVYFHTSWHHGFSIAHTREDLADALDAIEDAARAVAAG